MRDGRLAATRSPGDHVGGELLTGGQPHATSLIAETDLDVYVLGKDELRDLMETNTHFCDEICRIAALNNTNIKRPPPTG